VSPSSLSAALPSIFQNRHRADVPEWPVRDGFFARSVSEKCAHAPSGRLRRRNITAIRAVPSRELRYQEPARHDSDGLLGHGGLVDDDAMIGHCLRTVPTLRPVYRPTRGTEERKRCRKFRGRIRDELQRLLACSRAAYHEVASRGLPGSATGAVGRPQDGSRRITVYGQ